MDKKSKGFFFRSFAGHQSCRPSGFKPGLTCCHAPPELKAALGVPVLLSCWSAWNQTAVCVSDQCVLFAASRCASAPPWQWQLTRQVYTQAFPEDLDKLCCKSREGGHLLQTPPPRSATPGAICWFSHTERQTAPDAHTRTQKNPHTIRRHEIANTFTQRRQMETVWRSYTPAQINMKYSPQDFQSKVARNFFSFAVSLNRLQNPRTFTRTRLTDARLTTLRSMMRCKPLPCTCVTLYVLVCVPLMSCEHQQGLHQSAAS